MKKTPTLDAIDKYLAEEADLLSIQPHEFTVDMCVERAKESGSDQVTAQMMYKKLKKAVAEGKLKMRKASVNFRCTNVYSHNTN